MGDGRSDRGQTAREERARRLAEAMRENLRKRKAQERAREVGLPDEPVQAETPGVVDR